MPYKVSKITVWSTELEDHPGAVSEKLRVLADAGTDLEFVLARRQPDQPGKGILFVAPIKGKKQENAARSALFAVTSELAALRVEGTNKPGLGHRIADAVSQAGINLRGLMASVIGSKFALFLAFDNYADAERSIKELHKVK